MPNLFDGITYEPEHDQQRLTGLLHQVHRVMQTGRWYTLSELHARVGQGSEAGISARLRDLRKPRFGGHTIERRRRGDVKSGVFEYRMANNG